LAQLGHEVAVLNATTTPGKYRGVQFLHLAHTPVDFLPGFDVVVVLNWGAACGSVKSSGCAFRWCFGFHMLRTSQS
jgi:hypothetical protein